VRWRRLRADDEHLIDCDVIERSLKQCERSSGRGDTKRFGGLSEAPRCDAPFGCRARSR
jgi:hypothetical protein